MYFQSIPNELLSIVSMYLQLVAEISSRFVFLKVTFRESAIAGFRAYFSIRCTIFCFPYYLN